VATRLSGPAPLAVQFDATASRATNVALPFHQLGYEFDFGDDRGLSWAISGQAKNTQSGGPIAAHVFDNPGTYTVRVRVRAPDGTVASTAVTITVQDPASTYAGTRTVCVSPSSNYSGCPSGAALRTSLPSSYDGQRVLLRRGETFGTINIPSTDDGGQIAAYGTGAKPSVAGVYFGGSGSVADWPDEMTVSDLAVGAGGVNLETTGSRILLYRNDINIPTNGESQVNIGTAVGYYASNGSVPASSFYWPREIFLVENDIQGDTNGDARPNIVVMGWFMKSALLGNTMNRATEHTLRMWAAHKTIVAHNFLGGDHYAPSGQGIRAALKLHANGTRAYSDSLGNGQDIATSQVVVANNRIGSSSFPGAWVVGVGPQNLTSVEAVFDYIHENNVHGRGPYTSQDLHIAAQRATTRGNTVQSGGTFNGDAKNPADWDGISGMLPYVGNYFGQLTD
jgi:surface-anchored protein